MKRPFANRRPIGPLAQLDEDADDAFVVRFAFNKNGSSGLGDPFIFEEDDPDGIMEGELREAIRDVFTESELQYKDTAENELIYEPGESLASQRFGRSVVLWTHNKPSELNRVEQNIEDLRGVGVPEMTFVTVSEVR